MQIPVSKWNQRNQNNLIGLDKKQKRFLLIDDNSFNNFSLRMLIESIVPQNKI